MDAKIFKVGDKVSFKFKKLSQILNESSMTLDSVYVPVEGVGVITDIDYQIVHGLNLINNMLYVTKEDGTVVDMWDTDVVEIIK